MLPRCRSGGEHEQYRRLKVVTDAALAHLDLDDLLAELLVRIRDVLAVDTAAILLLDDASSELVARAAADRSLGTVTA